MSTMITSVSVAEFRSTTDHLFDLVRDFFACVDDQERLNWSRCVSSVLARVDAQKCTRTKVEDRNQRLAAVKRLLAIVETV